jgi:tetratricopeptide (TPR) repeat protein
VLLAILIVVAAVGAVFLALRLMPTDVSKALAKWEKLKAAGKNDEAEKAMGEVLDAGEKLYREKRFDEATRVFEQVIEKDPRRPSALNYLGVMARDRHDDAKAIEYFKKAAEVDPLSPMYYYDLALIYFERKDYDYCETQLHSAMRVSNKAQYRMLYALCAIQRKDGDEVIKKRLRDTIDSGVAQANGAPVEDLAPDAPLRAVWKKAAEMLAERGDSYGWDKLKSLSTEAKKAEARAFAKKLLAEKPASK